LASKGLAQDRFKALGLGSSKPVASNGNAEGRANNRRVEIVVAPAAKK
jgi:outer membrane protein OmpA-like peptidoglycan-associated protein